LAEAIGPSCKKVIKGIRPGEKIHETMITKSDSQSTIDIGDYFAILPTAHKDINIYKSLNLTPKYVDKDFSYSSANNDHFLNINEIRDLIKSNLDKNFIPV